MLKNKLIGFISLSVIFFSTSVNAKEIPQNIKGQSSFQIIMKGVNIVQDAGEILLKHYKKDVETATKQDSSPVTIADIESNSFITSELKKLTPDIPVISEESANISDPGDMFWLVDPMDGTKGFIKKTDQFTVNIALIKSKKPILGIIHLPVPNKTYFTGPDGLAYVMDKDRNVETIKVRKPQVDGMEVVASTSHRSEQDESYIAKLKVKNFVSSHSSIKFCLVAEGKADIYPRFGTTMEWDTGAGQALIKAAGGGVIHADSGKEFSYNKPDYRNGPFIAYGDLKDVPLAE